eukprot:7100106-Pyramimonas_sp.AAC.1
MEIGAVLWCILLEMPVQVVPVLADLETVCKQLPTVAEVRDAVKFFAHSFFQPGLESQGVHKGAHRESTVGHAQL